MAHYTIYEMADKETYLRKSNCLPYNWENRLATHKNNIGIIPKKIGKFSQQLEANEIIHEAYAKDILVILTDNLGDHYMNKEAIQEALAIPATTEFPKKNSRHHTKSHNHRNFSRSTKPGWRQDKIQSINSKEFNVKPKRQFDDDSWEINNVGHDPHKRSHRQSSGWKYSTKDKHQWEHNIRNKKSQNTGIFFQKGHYVKI